MSRRARCCGSVSVRPPPPPALAAHIRRRAGDQDRIEIMFTQVRLDPRGPVNEGAVALLDDLLIACPYVEAVPQLMAFIRFVHRRHAQLAALRRRETPATAGRTSTDSSSAYNVISE